MTADTALEVRELPSHDLLSRLAQRTFPENPQGGLCIAVDNLDGKQAELTLNYFGETHLTPRDGLIRIFSIMDRSTVGYSFRETNTSITFSFEDLNQRFPWPHAAWIPRLSSRRFLEFTFIQPLPKARPILMPDIDFKQSALFESSLLHSPEVIEQRQKQYVHKESAERGSSQVLKDKHKTEDLEAWAIYLSELAKAIKEGRPKELVLG